MSIIIIFNGEKLKPFSLVSLKSGTNTTSFLSPLKKNLIMGILTRAVRQEKRKKGERRIGRKKQNCHHLPVI